MAIPLTYGIGTLILWRLAGPSQIPAVAFEDIQPNSKEYIAGFEQGFEQRSKQKKVKAVQSATLVVVLSVVVTGALMAILVPWESQAPKTACRPLRPRPRRLDTTEAFRILSVKIGEPRKTGLLGSG